MLISFTQTYGNNRKQLLDIYAKDKKLHDFKNLFDLNLYSFHNCSDYVVDYFININPVKNTQILRYNNVSYTQCIKNMMDVLEENDCTHFFWSQDDTFSGDNDNVDFEELISFFKNQSTDFMLSFCAGFFMYSRLKEQNKPTKMIQSFKNYNMYENFTTDFEHISNMDDSPYIATFDVVKQLYSNGFYFYNDVWSAEAYLTRTFRVKTLPRNMLDRRFFQAYNLLGKNTWGKFIDADLLKKKGLL